MLLRLVADEVEAGLDGRRVIGGAVADGPSGASGPCCCCGGGGAACSYVELLPWHGSVENGQRVYASLHCVVGLSADVLFVLGKVRRCRRTRERAESR